MKEIKIPLDRNELNENSIRPWIAEIMSIYFENKSKYEHLKKIYEGKQEILSKSRPYDNGTNNVIVENHVFSMVEFKKGYMYGSPVRYTGDADVKNDDIGYLNKFFKDVDKYGKDIDLAEDLYIAGAGYYICLPKEVDNAKTHAPFDLYKLDFKNTFVVYSSGISHEKLFGGVVTGLDNRPDTWKLTVYTDKQAITYKLWYKKKELQNEILINQSIYLDNVPIIEYKLNNSRIGIVEIVETIQNAINMLTSSALDNIVDFVNSVLAIYNMEVDDTTAEVIKNYGILGLNTVDASRPADAKYIVNALQQGDVDKRYERMVNVAYNLVGVPLATTQSTSGGDTGQARLLGGGWTRADIVAQQDERSITRGERELLNIVLKICNSYPDCPINEITANQIEVKFSRMKTDNLLVKTQSLQTLISMNMPKEVALNIVDLTTDNHEIASLWEGEKDESTKETEQISEVKQIDKSEQINEVE